jgi:hypothetical protein
MNSPVVKVILGAALLSLPAALFAQRDLSRDHRVRDTALLTGPYLLSPAAPAKSPMPNQEWVFIDAQGQPQTLKLREGRGNRSLVDPMPGAFRFHADAPTAIGAADNPAELERARVRLNTANERLQKLRAERDAALARKQELDEAIRRTEEESLRPRGRLFLRENPPPLPKDPVRFEAQLPATPRVFFKKTPRSPQPEPAAPKN